jgi:alpha-ketoglutarate-dependent taurine dioxygenase
VSAASPDDGRRDPSAGRTIELRPLETPAPEVDFGVDAGFLDLAHLSDEAFAELERAVLVHQVVVVRGQASLSPRDRVEPARELELIAW